MLLATCDFNVHTNRAKKLWGRGRLIQEAALLLHRFFRGHAWGPWNVEPPEDELGRYLSPGPQDKVFCFRACRGGCGTVQHVTIRFDQFTELSHARDL